MALLLVNLGMTCSIVLFYTGLYFRFRNNRLHRILNSIGIVFNLITAFYLLSLKYLFGGLDAAGFVPTVDRWIIDVHRGFAAIALVLMLLTGWSGAFGKKGFHRKLRFIFLPLYTLVYISGLLLFRSAH
ncbi:hypothetical protein CH373_03770 [Leptospira perolatii]|uniref:DUF420 domain-containing protein n=1 Tax=Leptospira perolatii TaxID=2023191 RepID=A0A2M9ZSR2_9LEPT|nr:hypothetical protein [Leptospira perolatii]PJZ68782.1 hypothetical protein CH360_14650 [Leptospira perolatii]PJZ75137.1 hypothetical protein CH373_03770 [Leptospira perolatii]